VTVGKVATPPPTLPTAFWGQRKLSSRLSRLWRNHLHGDKNRMSQNAVGWILTVYSQLAGSRPHVILTQADFPGEAWDSSTRIEPLPPPAWGTPGAPRSGGGPARRMFG